MKAHRNALRVLTRRYQDDFQFGEELFETEDGIIPFEPSTHENRDDSDEPELKEAA